MRCNVRISRRVPLTIINAVEDTEEVTAALAQNVFESIAKLWRLDLFGVLAANGRDGVGVYDAALQKIHRVVVFELVQGKHVPGQQQFFHRLRRKPALIAGVVDRQYSRNVTQDGVEEVGGTEQDSKHCRLPVVNMEDIGNLDRL